MASLAAETVRRIESLVTEWRHDGDVPGVSVVVVDGDGERYAEGFGARDLETNAPATPDTLYGVGSVTKSLTALAIGQLAEAGRLSLDDPVDAYVDHFEDAPGAPITVAELLSHTSGMPDVTEGLVPQTLEGRPAGVADEADYERFVRASTEFRVTDADRQLYYNVGYDVLGRVIEAVDGRPYSEYVRDEIFAPLGMDRSTFDRAVLNEAEDAMTGYRPGAGDGAVEPTTYPVDELMNPGGGLITSVRELARYLRAVMTDGGLDGDRICSPAVLDRLTRGRAVSHTFLDGTEQEVGYGWYSHPLAGDEVVGHGGSVFVSTAYMGYLAAAGLGVVAAANSYVPPPGTDDLGKAILAIANGADRTAVPTFALAATCEAVTGTYAGFREEVTVTVERADGGIELDVSGPMGNRTVTAYPATLDPEDSEFHAVGPKGTSETVAFDLESDPADLYFDRNRYRRIGPAR